MFRAIYLFSRTPHKHPLREDRFTEIVLYNVRAITHINNYVRLCTLNLPAPSCSSQRSVRQHRRSCIPNNSSARESDGSAEYTFVGIIGDNR